MTQGLVIFAVKGVECQPGYITESSYFVKSTSQVLLSCPMPSLPDMTHSRLLKGKRSELTYDDHNEH